MGVIYQEVDSQVKLVDWIKRKLGYPSINLEIEDQSIIDNINDALQWYHTYSSNAKYRNALIIDLVAGTDTYTLNDNVCSIIDFDTTFSFGGAITTLFTVENIMYNEGLLAGHSPMELITWELAQEYIDLMRERIAAKFFVNYNKFTREIKFTPKPTAALTGILEVYSYWNHNATTTIYNEVFVKGYSLALTKMVVGAIWGKYMGMPLPGGGTLNGDGLKAEGEREKDYWLEQIINYEGEPLGFTVG